MNCECGNVFNPKNWGNGSKMCPSCVANRRRFELKKRIIEYLGGKCKVCGYDKCSAALDANHRNPAEKEFALSGKHGYRWEKIRVELDKCDLLCANCHREYHWNEAQRNRKYKEEYESTRHCGLIEAICECCSEKYFRLWGEDDRKYCSKSCATKMQQRIVWPSVEVLVERIRNSNFMTIGGELGVSDNAIRKYLIRNGVNPKDVRNIKNNGKRKL